MRVERERQRQFVSGHARAAVEPVVDVPDHGDIILYKVYIRSNLRIIKRAFIYCRSLPYYVEILLLLQGLTAGQGLVNCAVKESRLLVKHACKILSRSTTSTRQQSCTAAVGGGNCYRTMQAKSSIIHT